MIKAYSISELVPYINWLYFYHAWGLSGKPRSEKEKMQKEALEMLDSWEGKLHSRAIFRLYDACSEEDDLLFFMDDGENEPLAVERGASAERQAHFVRFPMLRQQHPSSPGAPNLRLADFVRPRRLGIYDKVGVFCTTVDAMSTEDYREDEYLNMMAQTLSDRLAEATAEKLHEEVRRRYWGYAPDEKLTIEQQHREEYQGIRPAIGYPSLPDTSANFIIDQLLDMKQVGIRLTESGMMTPHASVSGLMFAHPKARYFELGKIGEDQLRNYAHRRGVPVELMRNFLQSSLLK